MKNKANDHSKYKDWIDPNEVIPYERNAKKHDEKQVRNIANSIRRFGWQQDTVITSDNVLVIGHGRRLAALKLGCEMPYHRIDKVADELTDEDIRELRIADNQTNESAWDWELKEVEMADLTFEGFELDTIGTASGTSDDFLEAFFTPAEQPTAESHSSQDYPMPEPKQIQCPHCQKWFTP